MKKYIVFFVISTLLPVLGYEIYMPDEFKYQQSSDELLFVLDFSNSMGEFLEHSSKVDTMKNTLSRVLPQISDTTNVGLRVYGHTCNVLAFNACRSSELIVPIDKNNKNRIISAVSKLRPKGMTPITYSLKQAVNKDLSHIKGNKHIILLTDGGENCDESPCEYAISLVRTRKDINIDVIAFNVNDSDDMAQLKCTADVTGGRFIKADTNAQLFNALEDLTNPHKEVEAYIYHTE